jgi:hypothetical protein
VFFFSFFNFFFCTPRGLIGGKKAGQWEQAQGCDYRGLRLCTIFLEGGKMKKCELCDSPAKMYCESDQASLCWDCDSQVHGANFLVSKHSRTLLCHVCQSLTPWSGSGPKLSPTISVCESCVNSGDTQNEANDHGGDDDDDDDADDDDDDGGGGEDDLDREDNIEDDGHGDEDQGDIDEDDEENQVVPWSSTPPPSASSSSTSEEGLSDSRKKFSWKRMRGSTEHHSQVCLSSVFCSLR